MSPVEDGGDPYSDCRNAITWFERTHPGTDEGIMILRLVGASIDDIVFSCQDADKTIPDRPEDPSWQLMKRAKSEYDTSSFRKYLRARIYGAM